MMDLIDRRAAIDIVWKWFKKIGINGDICLDGLRQLPSVQSEPSDAVYRLYKRAYEAGQRNAQTETCDTCKHGYFGDEQCNDCRVRFTSHYERRNDDDRNG